MLGEVGEHPHRLTEILTLHGFDAGQIVRHGHEIVDHVRLEFLREIPYVERDSEDVGNTPGIAQVESKLTTAQGTAMSPHFYTVKQGDTLSKIAKDTYGDANRYHEIFEANRPLLKDADEIYPGQTLRLPAKTLQPA